jgi:hypothetical protein
MPPTLPKTSVLSPGDQIEITFGAVGAFLALLAVLFAAATWSLQRRRYWQIQRK